MNIKISDYSYGYKVVSLVKNEDDEKTAISRGWDYIQLAENEFILMPDKRKMAL